LTDSVTDSEFEPARAEPVADVNDWELIIEARVRRVRGDLDALAGLPAARSAHDAAVEALAVVEAVLRDPTPVWRRVPTWWTGWRVERAWRALHEAEVCVAVADPELAARLPALRERVAPCLSGGDLRRLALDGLHPAQPPCAADRVVVTDALRAAFDASDEAHASARALRNKLFVAGLVLIGLNTLLGVLGFVRPGFVPMCVERVDLPGRLACASGGTTSGPGEVWLTQVMGAVGAIVASVVSLVRRRPSLSPYILIGYQALIKVLLGALLAVVGVLALGAGIGEGLIGIRTQAAVLVAAVVFGYAQQLGTRLLDNYADRLLNRVRPLPRSGESGAGVV
jgi:hypothetical protein